MTTNTEPARTAESTPRPSSVPEPTVRRRRSPRYTRLEWSVSLAAGWALLVVGSAVFADMLPIAPYTEIVGSPRTPPALTWPEPLGTDALGRSNLSRTIHGARVSLLVGLLAVALAMTVGGTLGVIVGYVRGWSERIMAVVTDSLLAFPPLILLLAIAGTLGTNVSNLIVALSLLGLPTFYRIARANTLSITERDYVVAARALGYRHRRILGRVLIPNVTLPVASYAFIVIAVVIVAEGSLSFLGFGLQPPTPSWGGMISAGRSNLDSAPYLVFVPAAVMFLTVFALNTLGDWARTRFDALPASDGRGGRS